MIGEAAPYNIINDNMVMLLFVANLIGMAYVFLMNGNNIAEQAKSLFYYKEQQQPYSDRTHITKICNALLEWQTIFYCSLLSFGYLQYEQRLSINDKPYLLLSSLILLFTLALILKKGVYYFCNSILFSSQQAKEWQLSFFFTIKIFGFILFPVVAALLFIRDFSKSFFCIYMIFATALYLFVTLTNSIKIIFKKRRNYLDIFLYLCALELLPMAILWKFVHELNDFLIIKF